MTWPIGRATGGRGSGKRISTGFLWLFFGGLLTSALSSCTSISFEGKGLIPVYLTARPNHKKTVRIEGHKEFYLWGLIGPDRTIYLDEEFYDQGLVSVAAIDVHEYQKTSSFLKALFSFGFYIPKDYVVTGRGVSPGGVR